MIFKALEDEAGKTSFKLAAIFSRAKEDIDIILSKPPAISNFDFSDGFEESLKRDISAIEEYKSKVHDGMSESEAMASSFREASAAAREYAESTNFANINIDEFTNKQRTAQVSTLAQNKSWSNVNTLISEYNTGLTRCGLSQEEYLSAIKQTNPQLAKYLANVQSGNASVRGYIGSLIGAKAATIGLQIATAALNAAISFGISIAISAVVSLFDDLMHREEKIIEKSEKARETIQSLTDEFKEDSKTVEDISERYAKLAQKVGDLGKATQNKGSLTTDEYEEFLDLSNQLAEVFPTLTKGYDDNGNAILNLSGDVNTIVKSLDDLIERQKQLTNQEIVKQLPDLYRGFTINVSKARDEVKRAKAEFEKIDQSYKNLLKYGTDTKAFDTTGWYKDEYGNRIMQMSEYISMAKELGLEVKESNIMVKNEFGGNTYAGKLVEIIGDVDDIATSKLEKARENLSYAKQKLEAELSSIGTYMNTWLQNEWMYISINDKGIQSAVQEMLLSFDPSNLPDDVDADNWDAVSEWIRKNILFSIKNIDDDEITEAISELFNNNNLSLNEINTFIDKIKGYFGEDSPVYLFIKPKIDELNVGNDYAKEVKRILQDEFDDKVNDLSLDDLEIASNLEIPDGTLLSWDELLERIQSVKEETGGAKESVSGFIEVLSSVNELKAGLDELDKIYADIINGEDFDYSALISDDFANKFKDCDEAYQAFIEKIANSPNDIKACQSAFDDLITTYIDQSGILNNLTDETRNVAVAMLEQMGVANAEAIVDKALAVDKAKLKLASEDLAVSTWEEASAKLSASNASDVEKQALAELLIEKLKQNNNKIDTKDECGQLLSMANTARAATTDIERLTIAMALFNRAEALSKEASNMYKTEGDSRRYQKLDSQAKTDLKSAQALANKPISFKKINAKDYVVNYTGGSATKSARSSAAKTANKSSSSSNKKSNKSSSSSNKTSNKSSSSSSKEETWFDKQYKQHKHLVAMEQETDEAYYKWLNSAMRKAYNSGIIELDDFRKYQEEVFSGLRALFKDHLNDVEHEIKMRENYDGEAKKIISLYKTLISKVEAEIAAARKQGLTNNDDYIQELQDKWISYSNSIKDIQDDITNAAKDALDDLVDYRIDMIKKDVEREKDALGEKLDNLKEFYDKQKKMLQDAADEEKYLDEQSEKRKSVTDIQSQLQALEYDESAWAKKRKLELNQQLADAKKDLNDFEKEHALDLALDAIDAAYDAQETQIKEEMDALEEKLNDPSALYNQALTDIKNNSKNQLYYTMLMYNRQYGSGKDSDINEKWEKAYGALDEYQKLFGKAYENVTLKNETGYKPNTGWNKAPVSGAKASNKTSSNSSSKTSSNSSSKTSSNSSSKKSTPKLDNDTKRKVAAAIWNGGYGWGKNPERAKRLTEVFGSNNGIQDLVSKGVGRNDKAPGKSYTYLNMRKKFKGYASGTHSAIAGLHAIDELGTETIFQSADGTKYKMFTGGEKVLNAKASDFLFDFANHGGEIIEKFIRSVFGGATNNIKPLVNANNIDMGDIIIQGNTNKATVSEIRRAQRDSLETMLKELTKLNK